MLGTLEAVALAALASVCWAQPGRPNAGDLAAAETALAKLEPEIARAQTAWEKSAEARAAQVDWSITRGLVVFRRLAGYNRFDGKRVIDVDLENEEAVRFGNRSKFTLSAWILSKASSGAILTRSKNITERPGYGLALQDGKAQFNLVHQWQDDALRVEMEPLVGNGQWHNVTATYDGSGKAAGIRMYLDGRPQKVKVSLDGLHGSFETQDPLFIAGGAGPDANFRGQIRGVRLYQAVLNDEEAMIIATDTPVDEIAQIPPEKRSRGESQKIRFYFLERGAPPGIRDAWQRVMDLRNR